MRFVAAVYAATNRVRWQVNNIGDRKHRARSANGQQTRIRAIESVGERKE